MVADEVGSTEQLEEHELDRAAQRPVDAGVLDRQRSLEQRPDAVEPVEQGPVFVEVRVVPDELVGKNIGVGQNRQREDDAKRPGAVAVQKIEYGIHGCSITKKRPLYYDGSLAIVCGFPLGELGLNGFTNDYNCLPSGSFYVRREQRLSPTRLG